MIKNIIFDLGGVILEIDKNKTISAFENLGINFHQIIAIEFWEDLNTKFSGAYSLSQFSEKIRHESNTKISNEEIEKAWVALLGNFDLEKMRWLKSLSKNYKLFLSSNTDSIHVKEFEKKCLEQCGKPLESYFEQTYYSNKLLLRKPDSKSFDKVIKLSNILPDETIFIDDKLENVEAARKSGLFAHQLTSPSKLTQLNFVNIENIIY